MAVSDLLKFAEHVQHEPVWLELEVPLALQRSLALTHLTTAKGRAFSLFVLTQYAMFSTIVPLRRV